MKNKIKNNLTLIAISLFLTFTVCLYAPLSIYTSNEQEVWYNLRTIWSVPVTFFVVMNILLIGFGVVLNRKWQGVCKVYLGLLYGLAVCFYIQGNFIGIRLPFMNGNKIEWSDYASRMRINVVVWIVILVLAVILFIKLSLMDKISRYSSLLFLGMQFVSLVTLLSLSLARNGFPDSTMPALTSKGIYEVGNEGNIIVFILDTYDEKYFEYVQNESPDIIDELDGFTFYDNFTSVYPTTSYSLACILGGNICRNEMAREEWVEENSKKPMYFDELEKNGYEISLYTSQLNSIPKRIREKTTNYTEANVHFYNTRTCFSILYRLAACQYFPDILKPYVWMDGTEISKTAIVDGENNFFNESNSLFKENLDNSGMTVKDGVKQYKFIHLYGTHEPFYTDEWGNETEQNWDWHDSSKGCLRIVLDYISKLKELGLYDDSTIIISADHGNEGYPGILSNPVFLMKTPNSHGKLETCSNETGFVNYAATIADLSGTENTEPYGLSILDITEDTRFDRYYYNYVWEEGGYRPRGDNGNYYLVEYLTAEDTNDTSLFKLTDVEYTPSGEKIPHKQYCSKCMESNGKLDDYDGWDMFEHRHIKDFPY